MPNDPTPYAMKTALQIALQAQRGTLNEAEVHEAFDALAAQEPSGCDSMMEIPGDDRGWMKCRMPAVAHHEPTGWNFCEQHKEWIDAALAAPPRPSGERVQRLVDAAAMVEPLRHLVKGNEDYHPTPSERLQELADAHAAMLTPPAEPTAEAEAMPKLPSFMNAVIFLARHAMDLHDLHLKLLTMGPLDAREYISMKWPIIQGTRQQHALRKVGDQQYSSVSAGRAIHWLAESEPEEKGVSDG